MPTWSCTCHAERLAKPRGGSSPTTPNMETGNCPGFCSTPTAAGRLPSEGESYAQSVHSELLAAFRGGRGLAAALTAVEETVEDADAEAQGVDRDALVD